MKDSTDKCTICGESIDRSGEETAFTEAGIWLAENHWGDSGRICALCLENRGRLAMMYLNESEL